ncbi:doublecortin domain-containing protein 2B [Phaenicophaeus curvirostris]|uniref:doublecortin domain-containing protein 2B n=1 Tax=Phaenicophaeus curvirostris TaxID=33595 RepID=UPI0037F0F383
MSSWGSAPAPPAKSVVVYRNGDPFFPGRKLVVSPRRFLTFEAFLAEVTVSIGASVAVRNLYTARHGHRVAALGDLQDGRQYVAAGFEKFKKLDYLRHGRTEPRGTRQSEGLRLRAAAPWKPDIVTQQQTQNHLPRTIHVFRNGDLLSPPFPVLLSQGAPWDELLATLTERAALRSGAVSRLCRLDGTPVSCEEELLNGGYYVAVGNEEYKELPYLELLVPQDSSCGTPRCVERGCAGEHLLVRSSTEFPRPEETPEEPVREARQEGRCSAGCVPSCWGCSIPARTVPKAKEGARGSHVGRSRLKEISLPEEKLLQALSPPPRLGAGQGEFLLELGFLHGCS